MSLELQQISRIVGGQTWIDNVSLTLQPGSFNVFLGRTLAGKTSLMRLIAGLDQPSSGKLLFNGEDVTGRSVRERNISMVYQQFINYPNLSVFENIASPLRIAGVDKQEIQRRVRQTAELLHIEDFLERFPLELSGGQQQRTAMARALIKDASIILFDEPLVNLDYKLREEFRQELKELLKTRDTIAIYATTEPNEALALGGNCSVLHQGQLLQHGPTTQVYNLPQTRQTAELFSEPPMNLLPANLSETEFMIGEQAKFHRSATYEQLSPGRYDIGFRPSHIQLQRHQEDDMEIDVQVDLAEISGSDTFLHVRHHDLKIVLHLTGVHDFTVDDHLQIYLPTRKLFAFEPDGSMVRAPHLQKVQANG